MVKWYAVTPEAEAARLVAAWQDAPIENEELCTSLLEVARGQVIAYAPAPVVVADPDADPPSNYVLAQLEQAKTLWNAGRVSSEGNVGMDGFTFTPRPLDKNIKRIIRPAIGRPRVL